MQLIINNEEYTYEPDFPDGWRKKFQDYFKYPVTIGEKQLFIKRFKRKPLAFELLRAFKDGVKADSMPEIFALKYSQEEQVFYLFQEYIKGGEFDTRIKGIFSFSLKDYAQHIFRALDFVHKNDFWYTDFTIENILIDQQRNFYLIDIDSCKPVSEIASNDNIKDASFSGSVFVNLKKLNPSFEYGDIDGIQLNRLQLLFSIIHFYNFTINRGNKIYSDFSVKQTADTISSLIPFIDEIFKKSLKEGIDFEDIQEVVDYIAAQGLTKAVLSNQPSDYSEVILTDDDKSESEEDDLSRTTDEPSKIEESEEAVVNVVKDESVPRIQSLEINGFKRNRISLKHGEPYMLSWSVIDATHIELDGKLMAIDNRTKQLKAKRTKTHKIFAINKNSSIVKRSPPSIIQIRVEGKTIPPPSPPLSKPKIIYFKVDESSQNLKVPINKKVFIKWEVKNVDFVKVNGVRNQPKGRFTKIIQKPYVFTLEVEGIKKLIKVGLVRQKPAIIPEIKTFAVNNKMQQFLTVKEGQNLQLSWFTKNANKVKLFRNGSELSFNSEVEKSKVLLLKAENKTKSSLPVEFKLVALSEDNNKVEKILNVIIEPKNQNRLVPFLLTILIILLTIFLFFLFKNYM